MTPECDVLPLAPGIERLNKISLR